MFDLLIRNAEIFDGTGSDPYIADVAVENGKIAAVGKDLGAPPRQWMPRVLPLHPALLTPIPTRTGRFLPIRNGTMCCAWV